MDRDRAIDALVGFARLVSDTAEARSILPSLGVAIRDYVLADGVCIVEVTATGGARIAVALGIPPEAERLALDPDALGQELGLAVSTACAGAFGHAETRPLVAGGNLFGSIVMLFAGSDLPSERQLQLADGLVDLAAMALATSLQREKLEASHAALRASQDVLARTEKLRALGQMAAGVSHDLKNILNPLSLHLQFAERVLARGKLDETEECLKEMKHVVVRGVETVERLRAYSRNTSGSSSELVRLDGLAREAAGIAKPRMASTGRVLCIEDKLEDPPAIRAVASEVVNAVVNLIVNAIDAAGSSGKRITLRSGEERGGSYVEVEDDGPGMPPEIARRIFEPFFTTKGAEGTGLGLAMVDAMVQRYGGSVTVDTAIGQGTRIRLWFPCATSQTHAVPEPLAQQRRT